jgi:thiol:disulfide interchange protein
VLVLAGCGAGGSAQQGEVGASDAPVVAHTTAAVAPRDRGGAVYDPRRDAAADIAAAKKASAKDGRPVLIDFGADWCPDCLVLNTTFERPVTAQLLAAYHVVRVDVGEFDHNLDVAGPYVDLHTSGIPALAVVDSSGRLDVATNGGEFANARSMPESQVDTFLKKWA